MAQRHLRVAPLEPVEIHGCRHLPLTAYASGGMIGPVDVFQAIAQPKRRQLLDALVEGPRTAGELVDLLGEAQPAVSKHLRVLRDVGLASSEAAGAVRVYSIDLEGLRALDAWLEPYRRRSEATLDQLEHFLDEQERRP